MLIKGRQIYSEYLISGSMNFERPSKGQTTPEQNRMILLTVPPRSPHAV
jgi:hypothetical protein